MAAGEKKVSLMTHITSAPGTAKMYIVLEDGSYGYITKAEFLAGISGGSIALDDITDVVLQGTTNRQVLSYNATSGKWENITLPLPTLQEILDNNNELADGNNFQGIAAGFENEGLEVLAFGDDAARSNEGNKVNALGNSAANLNTGTDVNALGSQAAQQNTGDNVNALGRKAGFGNIFKNVNLFGYFATADADHQTVFSKVIGLIKYLGRLSFKNITADRKWELPDADGTLALTSDILTPTLQEVLDNNHDLADGNNFQGTDAGIDNNGVNVNGFGALSLKENTGEDVNAFGVRSGIRNSGRHVNAFGNGAGEDNEYDNVNLFGLVAFATGPNQTVFSKVDYYNDTIYMVRLSFDDLTQDVFLNFPSDSGVLALRSDFNPRSYTFDSGSNSLGHTFGTVVVYLTGTASFQLPNAEGNSAIFKVKNIGSQNVTVTFTNGQNADGETVIILTPFQALEFISNNTNYNIF
jgi:hypothetical protein